MEFEKNVQELSLAQIRQLRDACSIAINSRAMEHETAIRKAIMNAYNDGFAVCFSNVRVDYGENPDAPQFFIDDGSYEIYVEE